MDKAVFKRKGKLKNIHLRIGKIIESLILCGFGGFYRNERAMKKPVLRKENDIVLKDKGLSKEGFESTFLQKRFSNYISGNLTLEKSKSQKLLNDKGDLSSTI